MAISLDILQTGETTHPIRNIRYYPRKIAFTELKKKGIATGMTQPGNSVTIDNISQAYSSKPAAFKEEYLEPVRVFRGDWDR